MFGDAGVQIPNSAQDWCLNLNYPKIHSFSAVHIWESKNCTVQQDGIKGPMMIMYLLLYYILKSDARKYAVS
jgi:hypothetical protein